MSSAPAPGAIDTPWPARDVVAELARAVRHLHDSHNCDHHGYEVTMQAAQTAEDWLALPALAQPTSPPHRVTDEPIGVKWRCRCGRLNIGLNTNCTQCGTPQHEPDYMSAGIAAKAPAPTDIVDRYPAVNEYHEFGASDRWVPLLTAVMETSRYVERHGIEHHEDHASRHGYINAMGNAEGDLLVAIAALESENARLREDA